MKKNKKSTGNQLIKSNLKKIDSLKYSEINYSDSPKTNEHFWKDAKVIIPEKKIHISIRIDKDIIDWFKNNSKNYKYQGYINSVLRSYIQNF